MDVIAEDKKEIHPNMDLEFTYEVIWKQSEVTLDKRFERYLDPSFFQHRVGLIEKNQNLIPLFMAFRSIGFQFSIHS